MTQGPFYRNHLVRDAIGHALYDQMKLDPSIHLFGEGAEIKMHYDAPQIEREMPNRVHTLPISEEGNVNFVVGASLVGIKPVYDVITADFLYRAFDAIANTAAKLKLFTQGESVTRVLPLGDVILEEGNCIVIRAEFLVGGPTTGQRPEALFTHIPGISVAIPSTPRDAYGLMKTALSWPGVTLFFEDRMIIDSEIKPQDEELPLNQDRLPFGVANIRRADPNPRLTIITYGLMRQRVEAILEQDMAVELIDLRTLYPIDWGNIADSLNHTNRLLIIEPDITYAGVGAEIVATIAEQMPDVRVKRLGAKRSTIPAATSMHRHLWPTDEEIFGAITKW